jgi:alpha-galactosidase/6-phospho-beta-glucosidase family protein
MVCGVQCWKEAHPGCPVVVNEFGLAVNEVGFDHKPRFPQKFMAEELRLFESIGVNHAVWIWAVRDETYTERESQVIELNSTETYRVEQTNGPWRWLRVEGEGLSGCTAYWQMR